MTDTIWYPVTGDGQSQATQYIWNAGQLNWNTSFWSQGATLIFANPENLPTGVPGSGTGGSSGPGLDNVGLVAGEISSLVKSFYVPNPSKGDPFIGSNVYSIDLLINSGTVDINNLLLSGFNQYADAPQLPTIEVQGATFKVEGSIANSQLVVFPTVTNVPIVGTIGGTLTATGGGTVDIGGGGTVQIAAAVQSGIDFVFKDNLNDLLSLGGLAAGGKAAFAGTVSGFVAGDTIFLGGLTNTASYTPSFSGGVLSIVQNSTTLAALTMTGGASTFQLQSAAGGTDIVTCFAAGTRIACARGEIAVEDLVLGDKVHGHFAGGLVPVTWIGRRRIDCRGHRKPELVWPVRIAAGAFGDGTPKRDLLLSPDHAVFVNGVLIPIRYLIDGEMIARVRCDEVVYYHLELADHDVISAEGLPVETYLDTGDRAAFDNGSAAVALHPEFGAHRWETAACARLVVSGPELEAARRRPFARRAA